MLTPGQASDLTGFDGLAESIPSDVLIGDKGYDADKRVRAVLAKAGKTAVIAPESQETGLLRQRVVQAASQDRELLFSA